MGQQGSLTRIWAPTGTRPRVVKQQQFISSYIFGAVCPEKNKAAAIASPVANAFSLQFHLDEISYHVEEGEHAVLVMDQAGWHKSGDLNVPDNISILFLPSYSPELNPQEQIWEILKDRYFKNREYESEDQITRYICKSWNHWLIDADIKKTCSREWAKYN